MDENSSTCAVNRLTDRELEVLRLMGAGRTNQAIADQLTLSYNTVTWYIRQIFNKLGVDRRAQAVAAARALGVLDEAGGAGSQVCAIALTQRELEVLRLIDAGLSNQAIASQLVLSYHTVTGYVRQVFKKLGVASRMQAIATAHSLGILNRARTDESGFGVQHNLPVQVTPFIGRERELAEIRSKLKGADCQLLTLLGPGGSGKTRLAIEAAKGLSDAFEHGICFVSLVPLQDADKLPSAIARALNLSLYVQRDPKDQLLDYLQDKDLLLVLDNFEHLLDGVNLVNDILLAAPGLKILVTSRISLTMMGEHLYPVWGMAYPEAPDLVETTIDQYGALRLFESVARRRRPAFELGAENIPHVIRICALVEGMPLGIILAASWVTVLAPAEIAAEIARDLAFLESELRDLPPRQRSLVSVFNHSWGLLSEYERQIMAALSVFRGSFTREAAQKVAGASRSNLMGLTDKTMLHCKPDGRFEVHELLRQYAAEKLAEIELEGSARDRHLDYFRGFAEQAEQGLVGPEQVAWLEQLDQELDNFRAALSWACETDVQSGLQLSASLRQFWDQRYITEGEAWLSQLLDRAESVAPDIKAKALLMRGSLNNALQNFDRAQDFVEMSLALYREIGDQSGIAYCLGQPTYMANNFKSNSRILESIAIFRVLKDNYGIAESLRELALFEGFQKNYGQAMVYLKESESLFREMGHLAGIADVLSHIGLFSIWQGSFDFARPVLEECLLIRESLRERGISGILKNLGILSYRLGDYQQACLYLKKSFSISIQTGENIQGYWVSAHLGYIYLRMGEINQAQTIFVKCQQQFSKGGDISGVVYSTEGLASLALVEGQAQKSARLFGWADAAREADRDPRPLVEQKDVDQDIATIIERIGEDAYSAAYAEGRSMTMEKIIAYSVEE